MVGGKKGRWPRAERRNERFRARFLDLQEEDDNNSSQSAQPQQLPIDNKLFEEYYVEQGVFPKEDAEKFMEQIKTELPLSFRFTGDRRCVRELVKVVKREYFSKLSSKDSEEEAVNEPSCVPWLPDESAWQMVIDYALENAHLDNFMKFLYQETECGSIIQQDVAGMLPAVLLDVKSSHKVLDLRASPGLRTTHLIDLLHSDEAVPNPDGVVIANETHIKRCYFLRDQIRRHFSPNFAIVNMDANNLPSLYLTESAESEPFLYDRILCGFPSSGDGMFRNNLDGLRCWTPTMPLSHHVHLIQMLYSGLSSLAIGGRLVFTTYSMNPIESEAVVYAVIMQQRGTVELEDVSKQVPDLPYEKGMHTWKVLAKGPRWFRNYDEVPEHFQASVCRSTFPPSKEEAERVGLDKCIRILPHKQDTVGMFIAVFKRTSSLYEAWQREQDEQQKAYQAAIEEEERQNEAKRREERQKLEEEERKRLEEEKEKKKSEDETAPNEVEMESEDGKVGAEGQHDSGGKDIAADNKEIKKEKEDETLTREGSVISKPVESKEELKEETEKSTEANVTDKTDLGKQTVKDGLEKKAPDDYSNGYHQSASAADAYKHHHPSSQEHDGPAKTDERKAKVEGSFVFVKAEDAVWTQLKEFYGIADALPFDRLTYRAATETRQDICFVSETIKKLIEVNQKIYSFVSVGVPIFVQMSQSLTCPHRLAQEGLSTILPFMTKRIIKVSAAELTAIIRSPWPALDELTEKTKNDVVKLESGGFVFVLKPEKPLNALKYQVAISAWKDEGSSYQTFIPEYLRLHYLRIIGADLNAHEEKSDVEQFASAMEIIAKHFPV